MMAREIGAKVAGLLFEAGAISVNLQQPFILAAGWASPVYVDCRLLLGDVELRRAVTDLAADYLASELGHFDAIAGAETSGIAFAAWLADRMRLPLRYVRKHPLGIGRNAQVEGGSVDGARVLLLDDLTTDGSSKLGFARGLRAAGATVEHILTLFHNNAFPGTEERLAEAQLQLHPLASWADILTGDGGRRLAPEARAEIESFLKDPFAWSTRRGGRMGALPQKKRQAEPESQQSKPKESAMDELLSWLQAQRGGVGTFEEFQRRAQALRTTARGQTAAVRLLIDLAWRFSERYDGEMLPVDVAEKALARLVALMRKAAEASGLPEFHRLEVLDEIARAELI